MKKILLIFISLIFLCFTLENEVKYAKCVRSTQSDSLNVSINDLLKDSIEGYNEDIWCVIIKNKHADIWILPIDDGTKRGDLIKRNISFETIMVSLTDTNYFKKPTPPAFY